MTEGDWKEDVMEGKGIEYFPGKERVLKYTGTWKNNLKDGKGVLYHDNGNVHYKGTFSADKFEGYGQYYQDNGCIYYDGWFQNEKPEGKGILYDKFGMLIYEGDFVEAEKNGFGIEFDKYSHNKSFEGFYKDNLRHGIGAELWGNGSVKYKGYYEKGMKHGRGIQYDWDGNKEFEGKWDKNERKHKTILFNFLPGDSPTIQSKKEIKTDRTNQLKNGMKLFQMDYNNVKKSERNVIRGKSSEINKYSPKAKTKKKAFVVEEKLEEYLNNSPCSVRMEKKFSSKCTDSNVRNELFYNSMLRE